MVKSYSVRYNRHKCYTDINEMYNDIKKVDILTYKSGHGFSNFIKDNDCEHELLDNICSSTDHTLVSALVPPWTTSNKTKAIDQATNKLWHDWWPDETDEKALQIERIFEDSVFIDYFGSLGDDRIRAKKVEVQIERWLAGWEWLRWYEWNDQEYRGISTIGLCNIIQGKEIGNSRRLNNQLPELMDLISNKKELYDKIQEYKLLHKDIDLSKSRFFHFVNNYCSVYELQSWDF